MLDGQNPSGRWLTWALASLAVGFLTMALYFTADFLSPLLFPRTFVIETDRGGVEVKRGMTEEQVLEKLGKPAKEEGMALRGFRQWLYGYGRDRERVYALILKKGRLDSVALPGERRPQPWGPRGGRRR